MEEFSAQAAGGVPFGGDRLCVAAYARNTPPQFYFRLAATKYGQSFIDCPIKKRSVCLRQTDRQKSWSLVLQTKMSSDRATCWSITINNPTEEDVRCEMPGWKLSGQYEQGEEGTKHFQGMLTTPQVRFSAVKRAFPRAHIEVARNKKALEKYTTKEDTRVDAFASTGVPTIFEYQRRVCEVWVWSKYDECQAMFPNKPDDEIALMYVDSICAKMIQDGAAGLEFVAINPMWRSSWKKFYRPIINRYASSSSCRPQDAQEQTSPPPRSESPASCV